VPADSPDVDDFEVPDIRGLTDSDIWQLAWSLVTADRPFHAHEVCEDRWRTCPPADRAFWRALAQWGAAETHLARGNMIGARRLAERAIETLSAARVPGNVRITDVEGRCRVLRTT
jgi:predicted metal-dependent hydrolase